MTALNGFAEGWLSQMWRASWQGGTVILGLWLLFRFVPSIPARARSWAWWIASVQLIARLAFTVPIFVSMPPQSQAIAPSGGVASVTVVESASPVVPGVAPATWILFAWSLAVFTGLVGASLRFLSARRLLKHAQLSSSSLLNAILSELWGRGPGCPAVRESDQVRSPLLVGWRRPTIVLSPGFVDEHSPEEVRMVLSHEIAHLRRQDHLLGIGPFAAQVAFFFHPLAWLAARETALAREEACDLDVLEMTGIQPGDYARLLLKLAQPRTPVAALGAALGYRTLRRRIMTLRNLSVIDRSRRGMVWLCLIALAALPWTVVAQSSNSTAAGGSHKSSTTISTGSTNSSNSKRSSASSAPRKKSSSSSVSKSSGATKASQNKATAASANPFSSKSSAKVSNSKNPLTSTNSSSAKRAGAASSNPFSSSNSASAARSGRSSSNPFTSTNSSSAKTGSNSSNPFRPGGAASANQGSIPSATASGDAKVGPNAGSFGGGTAADPTTDNGTTTLKPGVDLNTSGVARSANPGSEPARGDGLGAVVDLQYDGIDAAQAIASLLKTIHVNYAFKTEISHTKLTLSLNRVTAESALQTILRLLDDKLTYRIEGGTVLIVQRS